MNKSIFWTAILLLVAVVLQFINPFDSYFLTGNISAHLKVSPLTIFIFSILVDNSVLVLFRKKQYFDKQIENRSKYLLALIYYLAIIVIGASFIIIIRRLYFSSEIDFRVETLFDIGIREISWFFIFICLFITYLLISLLLYIRISLLSIPVNFRLLFIFIPVLIISVFLWNILGISLMVPVIFSFLIYLFVLDLYTDGKKMNSTWIFTFMILVAGFSSLIVFSAYSDFINNKELNKVKNLTYERNFDFEHLLSVSKKSITSQSVIGNYYPEFLQIDSTEFLKKLNSGFYTVDFNVFFNPVSGDYIKLDSVNEREKYYVKYYYNTVPKPFHLNKKLNPKYIVMHSGSVLFNNTGFAQVPIPENIDTTSQIVQYSLNGYSYIRYNQDDDISIIKINDIPGILRPLSLFSLFFVITGFIFFIIAVLNSTFGFLPAVIELNFIGIFTLKDRIQFSIIGLLIISFLILGVLTFHYFHNFFEENQKEKAELFSSLINSEIEHQESVVDLSFIMDRLFLFERERNVDLFLYDTDGKLINDKRRKKRVGENIPKVMLDLKDLGNDKEIVYYKYDKYLISVSPIKFGKNKKAFIGGYFSISNSSVLAASDILSNFLNIYVLLFLLSGSLAIALANSISKPIEILGEKLEILSLNEKNEVLNWERKDEIGKLISIYNMTVVKLRESAKIITKIERDSAWRDMAKQVAHEIKNPLTPLKLNIQYLQSYVTRDPDRAVDMVRQLAPALIEQINNLDKIATEFSDFAKMPSALNEKVSLNDIVKVVHDFFRKREDLDIQLYVPINDLIVFADKNHIVSILNNIIKNAIQAIPNEREGIIMIELYKKADDAIVKITDNGCGIPEEMKDKVFSPNFTTKSSGTGLGLAISSNMIQAFNGKIYFTTELDVGTSFYLEIPLMRIKENIDGQKRVSLDD